MSDPDRPSVPLKHDLGRVTTHGVLLPHWGCLIAALVIALAVLLWRRR